MLYILWLTLPLHNRSGEHSQDAFRPRNWSWVAEVLQRREPCEAQLRVENFEAELRQLVTFCHIFKLWRIAFLCSKTKNCISECFQFSVSNWTNNSKVLRGRRFRTAQLEQASKWRLSFLEHAKRSANKFYRAVSRFHLPCLTKKCG